jgi:hypothetical protein
VSSYRTYNLEPFVRQCVKRFSSISQNSCALLPLNREEKRRVCPGVFLTALNSPIFFALLNGAFLFYHGTAFAQISKSSTSSGSACAVQAKRHKNCPFVYFARTQSLVLGGLLYWIRRGEFWWQSRADCNEPRERWLLIRIWETIIISTIGRDK